MTSARATFVTGESRKDSNIGKRSREPLAELSTNSPRKRSKLTLDVHPGEQTRDESRASSLIPEFSVSRLDDALNNNDLFDLDKEDNREEDADATKVQEQARQFNNWFRNCERNDPLAHLSAEERQERLDRCHHRLPFMLDSFVQTAQMVKREQVNGQRTQAVPMTLAWWTFLLAMSTEKVLVRLMASLAGPVKAILGGPLAGDELMMLPSEWEGCELWGIYTDIFSSIFDGGASRPDVARYCGSGTSKLGLQSRLTSYERTSRGNVSSEQTRHGSWLVRTDVQMNLRVIAVFNQCDADKPYVLLMELLLTTLLQTLPMSVGGHYRNSMALKMIHQATPPDLPEAMHTPLYGGVHRRTYVLCDKA